MNVGELRKVLEGVDDSLPILVSSVDHSYRLVDFAVDGARFARRESYYCEDYGDDNHRPEEKYIQALIGF